MIDPMTDIDYSKVPKWMPRWLVRWMLSLDFKQVSKVARIAAFIGLGLVILKIGVDAFAPGYCSVARAILFFPSVIVAALAFLSLFGTKKVLPESFLGAVLIGGLLMTEILEDLRKVGFYGALDRIFAFGLIYVLFFVIPWRKLRGRFSRENH